MQSLGAGRKPQRTALIRGLLALYPKLQSPPQKSAALPAPANATPYKKTPKETAWLGRPVNTIIDGSGILDAEKLKKGIIKVGGSELYSTLRNLSFSIDDEINLVYDIPFFDVTNSDGALIIHWCSYKACGDAVSDQFLIEFFPKFGGTFVCVMKDGKISTYSDFGRDIEGAESCSEGMFYYGD